MTSPTAATPRPDGADPGLLPADGRPPVCAFIGWDADGAALLAGLEQRFPGLSAAAVALPAGGACAPLARVLPSPEAVFQAARWVFVAGGPAALEPHLPTIRLAIADRHVLVLLGPGWSLEALLEPLHERKLARCLLLPTAPEALGAAAYLLTPYFEPAERAAVQGLLGHLEPCVELRDEAHFEVLQSLAGFVPAAFYTVLEAMADGLLTTGLPRPAAQRLLASLLHGAAERLLAGPEGPAELRAAALDAPDAAEGIIELEAAGLRGIVMRALRQAVRRPARTSTRYETRPPHPSGD